MGLSGVVKIRGPLKMTMVFFLEQVILKGGFSGLANAQAFMVSGF